MSEEFKMYVKDIPTIVVASDIEQEDKMNANILSQMLLQIDIASYLIRRFKETSVDKLTFTYNAFTLWSVLSPEARAHSLWKPVVDSIYKVLETGVSPAVVITVNRVHLIEAVEKNAAL